jgi:hypothetical protein
VFGFFDEQQRTLSIEDDYFASAISDKNQVGGFGHFR